MAAKPRILVAPLDWGLGHATRCVPIIEEVKRHGGEPVLATAGRAYAYLKAEFPEMELIELPPYGIRYFGSNMFWNMALQAPRLLQAAWREHRQLQRLIRRRQIDAVISDNRFGCFSALVPSVFITHQLNIQIPAALLQRLANQLNHWFIRQYNECWIPDNPPGPGNLGGELSFPPHGLPFRHIGLLSRLRPEDGVMEYDILALLSGPEPQRTRLEKILKRQLRELPYKVLLVQGKTERLERYRAASNIEVVSYLTGAGLQSAMARSALVLCRSGYSTLMDLAAMGKKALLIPTPGQTEQEYLARRMWGLGYCPFQHQGSIGLERGVREAREFRGFSDGQVIGEGRAAAVKVLLASLKTLS